MANAPGSSGAAPRRRWDIDERGTGFADGAAHAPLVARLLEQMRTAGWVAEAPEHYLLPNIERACALDGSPWTLLGAQLDGAVYVVRLEWRTAEPSFERLRGDAFALIGAVAEQSTHVEQRVEAGTGVAFEVTTGMLEGGSHFAPHGHLLRLVVTGDGARRVASGATPEEVATGPSTAPTTEA